MSRDLVADLCEAIEESGAEISFSKDCVSGLVGGACQCWRCLGVTPDDQHPEWSAAARLISAGYEAKALRKLRRNR